MTKRMPAGTPTLGWPEVRPCAEVAFGIWTDQAPALEWAQAAWRYFVTQGRVPTRSPGERVDAAVRFMALAHLHTDWCEVARDEYSAPPLVEWAELLGVAPGDLVDWSAAGGDEDEPDWYTASDALEERVHDARAVVYDVLLAGFGSVSMLYASLQWASQPLPGGPAEDGEDLAQDRATLDEILNAPVTPFTGRAFEWVADGCPPLR